MMARVRLRRRLLAPYVGLLVFALLAYFTRAWSVEESSSVELEPTLKSIDLSFGVTYTPSEPGEGRRGELRVDSYTLSLNVPLGEEFPSKLCIDDVLVAAATPERGVVVLPMAVGSLPLCHAIAPRFTLDFGDESMTRRFVPPATAPLAAVIPEQGRGFFWYPFDTLHAAVYIRLEYSLSWPDGSGRTIGEATGLTAHIERVTVPSAGQWSRLSAEIIPAPKMFTEGLRTWSVITGHKADEILRISQWRRPLDQCLFVIVVLVMLGFVMLLAAFEHAAEFVEGGVAFFLGILSLRETMPLARLGAVTLVDFAVWALYFAFAATLVAFMVTWVFARRSGTDASDNMSQVAGAEPPGQQVGEATDRTLEETAMGSMSDEIGNDYRAWRRCADSLVDSARLLRENRSQLKEQSRHHETFTTWAPELMLWGYAVEIFLKALYLRRGNELYEKGKCTGRKHHDLVKYAALASYTLTDAQARVLVKLSEAAKWAGRYPVHLKLDESSVWWLGAWDDEVDALIETLRAELDC